MRRLPPPKKSPCSSSDSSLLDTTVRLLAVAPWRPRVPTTRPSLSSTCRAGWQSSQAACFTDTERLLAVARWRPRVPPTRLSCSSHLQTEVQLRAALLGAVVEGRVCWCSMSFMGLRPRVRYRQVQVELWSGSFHSSLWLPTKIEKSTGVLGP